MHPSGTAISDAAAELLRTHADETFVSQVEIARRTGISQSNVSKMFRRESKMTVANLADISHALGLSPAAVLAEAERSISDR